MLPDRLTEVAGRSPSIPTKGRVCACGGGGGGWWHVRRWMDSRSGLELLVLAAVAPFVEGGDVPHPLVLGLDDGAELLLQAAQVVVVNPRFRVMDHREAHVAQTEVAREFGGDLLKP